jgi:hypothetical protein
MAEGWIIAGIVRIWKSWSIRGLVIISFVAHLILDLFAGFRRREATSGAKFLLWVANQGARWAPTAALGMITIGSTSQKQQLATLWVAFMLLHAGMPNNITAYALEDSVLSLRQRIELILLLIGPVSPSYILIKNMFLSNGDTMLYISSVICFMAIGKYLEGAFFAQHRGNLENMRTYRKEKESPRSRRNSLQIARRGGSELDDEQILLVAHDMLDITKDAFIDYLDNNNIGDVDQDQLEPFSDTWDAIVYKVVNMELSLMCDKFLNERPRLWLHHALLCSGKWRRLRRLIVSDLNLFRFLANKETANYRMWSRTIGQYNLFTRTDTLISIGR